MKIKYISSIVVLAFLTTLLLRGLYGQDDDMKKAALSALEEWKKTFADEQVRQLGFDSKADFKASELGIPFKVYTVNPDKMMEYEEEAEFGRIVTETDYYVYPVISDGKRKALLWMVRKKGEWQVARLGSSELAKGIGAVEGAIEEAKTERGLEGAEPPKFVRVYQLYLDFFFIKAVEREYIVPMYTVPALQVEGSKFYTPSEVVPQWKQQLKKKMPPEEERGKEIIEG